MKVLSSEEVEELFDITEEQLDQWEQDVTEGIYHGEPFCPNRVSVAQQAADD